VHEGKTGIKNRTGFAAGSTALAMFVGRGQDWSSSGENRVEIRRSAVDYFGTRRQLFQFQELLEGLKVGVVLGEIGSGGSFAGRSVGVTVITGTVQLFTDEVFGISTVSES